MTKGYDEFLALLKYRRSIRKFKPDPVPDEFIMKILDAAHYAMSGGNSQPWEFIIIKDKEIKAKVFKAYEEELIMALEIEQQRSQPCQHPSFHILDPADPKSKEKALLPFRNWIEAPVVLAVLEDHRKQWGSCAIALGDACSNSNRDVLGASMGHLSMVIHLAAASLGLGSQRLDVCNEQGYKNALHYPEPLRLNILVPIGFKTCEMGEPQRITLRELVHWNSYDMSKYMPHKDIVKRIIRIRKMNEPGYDAAR
jgi:nitroreductase